ncbi:hypothetical protein RUND412_008682 [Rhizina undulata]
MALMAAVATTPTCTTTIPFASDLPTDTLTLLPYITATTMMTSIVTTVPVTNIATTDLIAAERTEEAGEEVAERDTGGDTEGEEEEEAISEVEPFPTGVLTFSLSNP